MYSWAGLDSPGIWPVRGVCFQRSLEGSGPASGPPSAVLAKGQHVLINVLYIKGLQVGKTAVTASLNLYELV